MEGQRNSNKSSSFLDKSGSGLQSVSMYGLESVIENEGEDGALLHPLITCPPNACM